MFYLHQKLNQNIYSNLPPNLEEVHRVATHDEPKEQVVKVTTDQISCRVSIHKKNPCQLPPLKYHDYDIEELDLQKHLAEISVQLCLLKGDHSSNFCFHLIEGEKDFLLVSTITKIQDRICFYSEKRPPSGPLIELLRHPTICTKPFQLEVISAK